jgi:hypothetical protein
MAGQSGGQAGVMDHVPQMAQAEVSDRRLQSI